MDMPIPNVAINNTLRSLLLAATLYPLAFVTDIFAAIDKECLHKLQVVAPPNWAKFREATKGLRFDFEFFREQGQPKAKELVGRFTFYRDANPEREMLIYRRNTSDPVGEVRSAQNGRYGFEVTNGSKLERNRLVSAESLGNPNVQKFMGKGQMMAEYLIRVVGIPLEQFVSGGDFKILLAENFIDRRVPTHRCIKVECRCDSDSVAAGRHGRGVYWFILDTDDGYIVRQCGFRTAPPLQKELSFDITTQLGPGGLHYLKQVNSFSKAPNGSLMPTSEMVATVPVVASLPANEYFLAEYGFSESFLPKEARNGWIRWLAAAIGSAGLVAAIWIIRKNRRVDSRSPR